MVSSTPSSLIEPPSAFSSPATRLSRVDLPMPDSPMTATYSPGARSRSTPAKTVRGRGPANDLLRSRTMSMAWSLTGSRRSDKPCTHRRAAFWLQLQSEAFGCAKCDTRLGQFSRESMHERLSGRHLHRTVESGRRHAEESRPTYAHGRRLGRRPGSGCQTQA